MKYLVFILLLLCNNSFAQKKTSNTKKPVSAIQKSATTWDELDKTFVAFIKALENEDNTAYTAISLKEVDCAECPGAGELGDFTHFVPAQVFYITVASDFKVSPVYKALIKRGYAFNSMVLKDFRPAFLPQNSSKDLKVYEVWVQTYKPEELSKGHKETSHAFQFIKLNGEFKFFGLTSQ